MNKIAKLEMSLKKIDEKISRLNENISELKSRKNEIFEQIGEEKKKKLDKLMNEKGITYEQVIQQIQQIGNE